MARIIAFPKKGIPYNDSFYRALEVEGAQVIDGDFSGRWLHANLSGSEYAHLHWPSMLYAGSNRRSHILKDFLRFVSLLLLIRHRGTRLIWTAHNLFPHDRTCFPGIDLIGRRIVIALSSRIFAHGPFAAQVLRARFPQVAEKVVIINHGNWIDFYPRSISRQDARGKLGIPQHAFAYLFIGLCKEYKNLDVLIDRFTRLPGNISLTIAGHFQSAEYLHRIHELAATDPRIMLHPRIIPNDELQEFLISADAVVLPYREILTSGTAMLAMSFGRPVVSIRHGHLRDVITPATGILYDPHDANGLLRALIEIRSRCFDETLILRHAKTFEWKDAASVFLGAL